MFILISLWLFHGHSYAGDQVLECQYLDRVHCHDCPAPFVFNCGGRVRFVKADARPRKVFVNIFPSPVLERERQPEDTPYDIAWRNIIGMSESVFSEIIKTKGDPDHRLEIDISSKDKHPTGMVSQLTDQQNQQGIQRWIKQKIVEKAPKLSESQLKLGEYSLSNFNAYSGVIDSQRSGVTGTFHLSSEDIHGDKKNFCWYGSIPQVIGFSEDRMICPEGMMLENKSEKLSCGQNDDGWKRQKNPCFEKRRKICFGQVKCVKNGNYEKSYNICAADGDSCPGAESCKKQQGKIENYFPKNLYKLKQSDLIRENPNTALTHYGDRGGWKQLMTLPYYKSDPHIVKPPSDSNFFASLLGGDDSDSSCNICVAPFTLLEESRRQGV